MKIFFLLVAILACKIQADEQLDLNRRSKIGHDFKNYIVGIFEKSGGISNGDCDYFSGLGTFSNNRDIFKLSRLLNSWMCDSQITKLLAEIAEGTSQLMQMLLKVVERKPEEETKKTSNNVAVETPTTTESPTTTETPTTTAKILAKEEMVLYVASIDTKKHVDIYDLVDDSKGFTLRASLPIEGQDVLLADATGNRLIAIGKDTLNVFNLNEGTGQQTPPPSNTLKTKCSAAAWDTSGKYLLLAYLATPSDLTANEVKEDGSLTTIATYTPTDSKDAYTKTIAFHPQAIGIMAIPYLTTNVVKFLRFDSEAKTIKPLSTNVPSTGVIWVVFSTDGQYMYALDVTNVISAFKITLDDSKNDVTKVDPIETIGTPQRSSYESAMIVSPSGKFLYKLWKSGNTIFIHRIDPLTGKLTPSGEQPTGGRIAQFMAISPKGTKLAVSDNEVGFFIYDIKEDGTLDQPKLIPGTKQPEALLFTKK